MSASCVLLCIRSSFFVLTWVACMNWLPVRACCRHRTCVHVRSGRGCPQMPAHRWPSSCDAFLGALSEHASLIHVCSGLIAHRSYDLRMWWLQRADLLVCEPACTHSLPCLSFQGVWVCSPSSVASRHIQAWLIVALPPSQDADTFPLVLAYNSCRQLPAIACPASF